MPLSAEREDRAPGAIYTVCAMTSSSTARSMASPRPVSRKAGDLPRPQEHAGTADPAMPFEHVVVVMMENHSFDNLLGDLGRTRSDVKALTFNGQTATDENPGSAKTLPVVRSFPLTDLSQANHITQSWKATHEQINDGHIDRKSVV